MYYIITATHFIIQRYKDTTTQGKLNSYTSDYSIIKNILHQGFRYIASILQSSHQLSFGIHLLN